MALTMASDRFQNGRKIAHLEGLPVPVFAGAALFVEHGPDVVGG